MSLRVARLADVHRPEDSSKGDEERLVREVESDADAASEPKRDVAHAVRVRRRDVLDAL